ncbi:Sec-independent protein translocase subunit TatA [Arthrobacter sp. Sa2CUA1]|uniref:Sec-independent protein translocase protein TatA n=1 Tax=Arthrobacter gallicola TaxID=2762225 RepID=A0ABR8UUW3_9MICC|nr:Sec-independent protein translocase subunit TatA [Arthrobacter gallicola]MBD7996350.1 Sec-independent protein translocase subunit TatA [Arthrobacter gallicola]
MRLEGWHIVIIIVLAILLFGAPKLPGLARSVGQSLRIFKSEVRQLKDEDGPAAPVTDPVTGAVIPPVTPAGTVPPVNTAPANTVSPASTVPPASTVTPASTVPHPRG